MNKNSYRFWFIIFDYIASALAWYLFFLYRKIYIETIKFGVEVPFDPNTKFYLGLFAIPFFWILIHYSSGAYTDIRRKSQFQNFHQLIINTLIGSFIIFFFVLLDDTVISYVNYYQSILVLFALQFLISWIPRLIILFMKDSLFRKQKDFFRTLLVGEDSKIAQFLTENNVWIRQSGIVPSGYLYMNVTYQENKTLTTSLENINDFIKEKEIEEVIILMEPGEKDIFETLQLKLFGSNVLIRIVPELFPFAKVPIERSGIFQSPLLLLSNSILPAWHKSIKVFIDIVFSAIALIILSPLILILAIAIKASSKGPILYSHERIGKNGQLFKIIKFRSMMVGAESNGPQLASKDDKRVTRVGRFMRKRRLDEIPNFINVLRGEMSLVGPRPERSFFINQIIQKAPQYAKLHLVKPGITSWGQVKYGYAENVDEMIKRMRFDLVYIENMSLYVDLQILLKTISTILKGRGI